jgi:ATP synthase protein I
MGLEVGLSVVVGFLIGSWLDEWLDTRPWFLLVFGIAGIIAGYRSMFRMVKRIQSDAETEQEKNSSSSS